MRLDSSRNTSALPAGAYAEPGIYVVVHREPAHIVPHEVMVAEATLLPKCRFCANVRFSLKSPTPELITDNQMFWTVTHELSSHA
jgi:hypothetical protein